jgi:hypothetical protein
VAAIEGRAASPGDRRRCRRPLVNKSQAPLGPWCFRV